MNQFQSRLTCNTSDAALAMQCSVKKSLPVFQRLAIASLTVLLVACSDTSSVGDSDNNNTSTATDTTNIDNTTDNSNATDTGGNNATDNANNNVDTSTEEAISGNDSSNNSNPDTTTNANTDADANNTDTTSTDTSDADNNTNTEAPNTNPDPIANLAPIVLSPMPSSPLTPAPDANDEPIPTSGPVSTVSEYFLVRDGGGPIPDDTTGAWTLADFEAGLPEPRISVPSGVNTTDNPAPFFEGLANQTVFAGETLNLLLRPTDSDGSAPGMFPEFIPSDSQYIDNFNRTKTLRWTPLQPDVGIHEMKFTAVDADAPQYRAEYTVLVQVLLPADQSGIQNLAPNVNAVRPTHGTG